MSELPAGWVRAPIADLGELRLGKMLDKAKNRGLPAKYLRNINVRWFRFDLDGMHTIFASPAELEQLSVEDGDLFVCEGGEPGRCAVWRGGDNRFVYQKALHRFRSHGAIVPELLMYRLRHDADTGALADAFTGTTIKHLTRESLARFEVPVPPLPEQKRIADKLDVLLSRVDDCRQRLDRVPAILKRFRQSVLAAATGGALTREWREARGVPVRKAGGLPSTWTERLIGELGAVQLGRQRSPKFHSGRSMRPYFRVQNVFEDRIDLSDVMQMNFPPEDIRRYELHPGDILLNEGQSPQFLGRPALYRGELPGACFTNTLIRFQANRALVQPEYALLVFRHQMHSGRYAAEGNITTNIAHLGAGRFSAVEFPLPPLEEQAEIVRRATLLLGAGAELERHLAAAEATADRIRPATLAKAFRGELVPQDPNDEPASQLLARKRVMAAASGAASKSRRSGAGKLRSKAKADTDMLTRRDVSPTHLTVILRKRGALTAEALWAASQLEIDEFYDQLKDEEARGQLREKRGDSSTAPRLLEAAA